MYWADAASSFGIGPLNPVSLQYTTPELLIGMIREVQSAEVVAAAKALQAREREEQERMWLQELFDLIDAGKAVHLI